MDIHSKNGFTLVEIMIVVGIIAILSGMFLVGAGKFRDSANDARRKSDLQKIAALQELCATKQNGTYASDEAALVTCLGGSSSIPKEPVAGHTGYSISSNGASATLSDNSIYSITW